MAEQMVARSFTKRPVTIEAVQWTGDNLAECVRFLGGDFVGVYRRAEGDQIGVGTLEDGAEGQARHVATAGDWLIRGVQGEHYACKDSIFRQTYDAVVAE